MSDIQITTRGSFSKTENYLRRLNNLDLSAIFDKYGPMGVSALQNATPRDSGLSALSWYYTIEKKHPYQRLRWRNNDVQDGVPVVILIEYGHGTRNGGIVQAYPFIMQAISPVIQQAVDEIWREVTRD
jgi:hypothetical protein